VAADGAARRSSVDVLAVIAVGGMLGATARYGLTRALPTRRGHFPWATFWTNCSGSFALGFIGVLLAERFAHSRRVRPFLATGIIGAYTTMSTFAVEVVVLVKDGHAAVALAYVIASVVAGLCLASAGFGAARLIVRGTTERQR
jgi:CrcB protein